MRYFKNVLKTLELFGSDHDCIENIYVFGSRATGLNEFDSDLDVAIQIGDIGEEGSVTAVWVFNSKDWENQLQEYIPYKVNIAHYRKEDATHVARAIKEYGVLAYLKAGKASHNLGICP